MSAEAKKKPESADHSSPGTSVEQIRDIIFGAQMRDYEHRFEELGRRLQDSIDALRREMDERFNLADHRLGEERGQREKDVHDLRRALEETEQRLRSELQSTRQELSAHLGSTADDLSHRKADRELLANLFRQAAAQIENGRPSDDTHTAESS